MLKPGDLIEVAPLELVAGGAALARVDGFPIFSMNLFPGDEATVRIVEVKKGFARAELIELRNPSVLRRAEPCPVAHECGGCDWTALRLDAQLDAKKRILLESLRRVGKVDAATLPEVKVHVAPLNYRLRSRLQVQDGQVGFFALGTRRVVPLPAECEVVGPHVIRNLPALREIATEIRNGEILTLEHSGQFRTTTAKTRQLTISVDGYNYRVGTDTFFQVNRHLLGTLLELVTSCASTASPRRLAFDLYSGVGFFTLPLARLFDEVIGVEEAPSAQRYATGNGREYRNVRFTLASVEKFVRTAPDRVDFVLVDPPRAGVSPGVLDAISNTTAALLCYLSCDPVTFSRDVSRLIRRGWSLRSLHLVDLFPNTHHVETFASFTRPTSGRTA